MCYRFCWQLVLVFVLALVGDVIAGVHVKSLVDNQLALAMFTVVLLNYTCLFGHVAFIDTKDWRKRVGFATAMALGEAVGTVIVVTWC